MADWRQIQARIRKAKNSSDPPSQLSEIYQRTRDAMVAFELAQWHEKAGNHADAAQWYTTAAQRFRRAQWRTKAEEALTRLGAPIPVASAPTADESSVSGNPGESPEQGKAAASHAGDQEREAAVESSAESVEEDTESSEERTASAGEQPEGHGGPAATEGLAAADGEQQKRKRRRGRRGGRGRGRRGKVVPTGTEAGEAGAGPVPAAAAAAASAPSVVATHRPMPERHEPEIASAPAMEREQPAMVPSWQGRTRAGEPALASRISQLESQLRRLLACPQSSLDEADQAPAGPGVLVLSDSDQVTHYYVESCQTLRIGVGNLLRGGRGSEAVHLKERMAENLGIGESKVAKYLKDHCAVRWLQLDEGARELAHFAISVLRPAVNE